MGSQQGERADPARDVESGHSPHRAGGQAQFIDRPLPLVDDDELADVLSWAAAHLDRAIDVRELSRRAHLSRRTFDRRFRDALGTSPLDWLQHQRVLEAQRLLESTDLPVEQIAGRVGFSSATALRPHFRRVLGVSPLDYRRTFREQSAPSPR